MPTARRCSSCRRSRRRVCSARSTVRRSSRSCSVASSDSRPRGFPAPRRLPTARLAARSPPRRAGWSDALLPPSLPRSPLARRCADRPSLLRLEVLARGRGGEHERERQPEDDRDSSSHDHRFAGASDVPAHSAPLPALSLPRARAPAMPKPPPAERAYQRLVVLVRDGSSPVVELELLERSKRSIARSTCQAAPLGLVDSSRLSDTESGSLRNGIATATTHRTASRAARAKARSTSRGDAHLPRSLDEPPLLARIRPHCDERAKEKDEACDPDQVHQGLDEHAEVHGAIRVDLLRDDEQIFPRQRIATDPDPRSRPAPRSCRRSFPPRASRGRGSPG